MEKYISLKEASKLLGYSRFQLRIWIKEGTLRAYKATPTSDYRIKLSDLETLMESGSTQLDEGK